jgi:hypothetical protein
VIGRSREASPASGRGTPTPIHAAAKELVGGSVSWSSVRSFGHTDLTITLGTYAQAMTSSDDDRERPRLLVEGSDFSGEDAEPATGGLHACDIAVAVTMPGIKLI